MKKEPGISFFRDFNIRSKSEIRDCVQKATPWFDAAKEDLSVSINIYERGQYPLSIYHLQQAFEKLIKSYYIYLRKIHVSEIRGHYIVHKIIQMEQKKGLISNFVKVVEEINGESVDVSNIEENIDRFQKDDAVFKGNVIRKLDKLQMQTLFSQMDKLEESFLKDEKIDGIETYLKNDDAINHLRKMIERKRRVRQSDILAQIDSNIITTHIQQKMNLTRLLFAGVLIMPHHNTTRYPPDEEGHMGFSDYDEELGVVECYGFFVEILERFIIYYENELSMVTNG